MSAIANKPLSYALQALCYAAFVAVVGYFSTSPPYVHLPAGEALVKLSFQHAGERKEACHERTAEELAKLAPNMRAASVCPRERVPVEVQVEMDGKPLFAVVARPSGLAKDGASTVYRRVAVPAGAHRIVARLKDAPAGGFGYAVERTVDLAPGRVLVIDFDKKDGGFVFRS
ncbi:MAG TPA: hypothetical protein VET86_00500 [Casimicrobiaceae bacterium]|jgi:hypothetical protein|nr:hypothetical protein [Casimicrobiaceae bacterium]